MLDAARVPDPFERVRQLADVADELKSLAVEFRDLGEPLRNHLNAVLRAGERWESLFAVGLNIPSAAWEGSVLPRNAAEGGTTPRACAWYALANLVDLARQRDRAKFDAILAALNAHAEALTEAEQLFPDSLLYLHIGYYRSLCSGFRARADAVLASRGMRLEYTHTADVIRKAGIPFESETEFAVSYWIDTLSVVVFLNRDKSQILPFGPPPPFTTTPEEENRTDEREKEEVSTDTEERTRGGGPQTGTILPQLLSASDIAKRVGRKRSSVLSFLTRLAGKQPSCRTVVDMRRKNESQFLYRTDDVWPALEKWLKRGAGD